MSVKTTVVGAWVEGAVKNWFTEEEDGRRMMGRAWRPNQRTVLDDEGKAISEHVTYYCCNPRVQSDENG